MTSFGLASSFGPNNLLLSVLNPSNFNFAGHAENRMTTDFDVGELLSQRDLQSLSTT